MCLPSSFGKSSTPYLQLVGGNDAAHVSYSVTHKGSLESTVWMQWHKKTLPLYYKDHFVYEIDDRLLSTGNFLLWESCIHALPKNSRLQVKGESYFTTWCRRGG